MNRYDYKDIHPFKWFVLENFPFIEADFDALTNWQLFCKIGKQINKIIDSQNEVGNTVETFTQNFVNLYNYVHDYFDNLDVQDEIDNKLDEMVEDGTLEHILLNYVNVTKIYDTTVEMLADAENLVDGMKIKTLGYYNINDCGGADFYITDTENQNIYQFPVGSLYAEIIVKNNINIRQLGAKGDGVTDDTQAFKNTLLYSSITPNILIPKGNFLISDNITLPNGVNLYGENTENSIIILSDWTGEHCIINEHFEYDGNIDTFTIKNLTFNDTKYTTINEGRMFGFCNTDGVIINNVLFKCDIDTRVSPIDIRSNNKNMLIDKMDCYFTYPTTISRGCINIREEYSYPNLNNRYTDNIIIKNCNMKCSGIDEMVWIDGWNGLVQNIYINDCNFYDVSKYETTLNNTSQIAENMIAISGKHIFINNCYFYKQSLRYTFARIAISHGVPTEDVNIKNCHFVVGDSLISAQSRFISITDSTNNLINNGVIIEDNYFTINDESSENFKKPLACLIASGSLATNSDNTVKSINNFIDCLVDYAFYHIPFSKGDIITKANKGFRGYIKYIEGINAKLTSHFIDNTADNLATDISIMNCIITTGGRLIATSGNNTITKILVQNCDVANGQNAISNYGNNVEMSIICNSVNFAGNIISGYTNQTLIISGVTINGDTIKGIPSSSDLRGALPVGTVLFSNTPTKSIVRKITDGSSTSNWEEI